MIKKLFLSQAEKAKTGFWSLGLNKVSELLFYLLILFLPTQLGKHFWPNFSLVYGLRMDYLSPTLYVTDVLIILIFLFYLPSLVDLIKELNKNYLTAFSLFVVSVFLEGVYSKNPMASIYGIIKFLEFSFLSFYIFKNLKNLKKEIIFLCFFTGIIFESFLSFLQYVNTSSIGGLFYFFGERTFSSQTPGIANASINGQLFLRPYATFSHPNVLAGYLVIAMTYLFLLYKGKLKQCFYVGIFLGTISLFLTLGRAAIILWTAYLLIKFGVLIFEKYKKNKLKSGLSSIILVTIVLVISLFLFFEKTSFVQRFTSTSFSEESVTQREYLTKQSFLMFEKSPLTGIGINNFYNNLKFNNKGKNFVIQPVHNIFLLVLSETGLVGLVFFIFILTNCVLAIKKISGREVKYVAMLIFSIIFLGMFDHYLLTLQQGQIMLSLIIGTVFSYKNI